MSPALEPPVVAKLSAADSQGRFRRSEPIRGLTLVEVMVSLGILAMFMGGFLAAYVQSRKVTESTVMHAAATSIVYGIIEQIKQLDYATMLPNAVADPGDPDSTTPPLIRVRLNQNTIRWLRVVNTTASSTPRGPTATPAPNATAASVGGGAIDNNLGSLPLSTVTGTASQNIALNLWIWIDEIPDLPHDVNEVKKITVIYTYSFQTGSGTRTVRNREVILRTRFDQ